MLKRIIALFAAIYLTGFTCFFARAESGSYIYNARGQAVPAPEGARYSWTMDGESLGVGEFKEPSDIYAHGGYLFITDKGNNRILRIDTRNQEVTVLDSYIQDGKGKNFSSPSSVTIGPDGRLIIADTGNKQLVELNLDFSFSRIIPAPVSSVLPENFDYQPVKAQKDTSGRILVVSRGFNMGIIELDSDGGFISALGAPRVVVSPIDLFWRMVSTKAQIERSASFVPTEYNNLALDDEDFLFVTTSIFSIAEFESGQVAPIRRLNALGNDILKFDGLPPYGDIDYERQGDLSGPSRFVDCKTMNFGLYAALDSLRGRVFTYNSEGGLLFVFGSLGNERGEFSAPVSLAFADNAYYVLDRAKCSVSVYELTEYGKLLFRAAELHWKGDYATEVEVWQQVLSLNNFNETALLGMGKAAYREKDYKMAAEYFYKVGNREYYSKAFGQLRARSIRAVFPYAATGVVVAVAALFVYIRIKARKGKNTYCTMKGIRYARYILFHPFDGFWDLKRENRGSLRSAAILLAMVCAAMAANSLFTGYIFRLNPLESINVVFPVLAVLLPLGLYVVCNWCVTTLADGEGKLADIFIYTVYALFPLLLLTPVATILSNILTLEEGAIYSLVVVAANVWALILIIVGNMQTHNFSMSKNLFVLLLTVIVMLLVVFIFMLILALGQQIYGMFRDMAVELRYRT